MDPSGLLWFPRVPPAPPLHLSFPTLCHDPFVNWLPSAGDDRKDAIDDNDDDANCRVNEADLSSDLFGVDDEYFGISLLEIWTMRVIWG